MKLKIALSPDSEEIQVDESRFETIFDVKYCHHLECKDWTVEKWIQKKCEYALKNGKLGELAIWLGKLHGKAISDAEIPDITIRWIHETIGYGIFTNRALAKWEFIGEYTGLLRQRRLIFPDVNDYCFMYPKEWKALKAFTIDSQKHGNFTRFINHSDTPNVESVSVYHDGLLHIIFRTIEEIPAGTQLTYDYGDIYWLRRNKKNLDE